MRIALFEKVAADAKGCLFINVNLPGGNLRNDDGGFGIQARNSDQCMCVCEG